MIGESLLPDFTAADFDSDGMRVASFDQLNRALQRNVQSGSQKQMYVVGHQHEGVQAESSLSAISIKRLQKDPDVRFNDKQSPALKSREGYEIRSGGRHRSGRFHSACPQRLKPKSLASLMRCDWKSHPSRSVYFRIVPVREDYAPGGAERGAVIYPPLSFFTAFLAPPTSCGDGRPRPSRRPRITGPQRPPPRRKLLSSEQPISIRQNASPRIHPRNSSEKAKDYGPPRKLWVSSKRKG
jgi:hypothetical protein